MAKMMSKALDLVDLVKACLGGGYALGAQGEVLTEARLAQFVRWNGRASYYFLGYSAEKWLGKPCWDCSGLIVDAMQDMGIWAADEDYKAQGIWSSKVVPIHKEMLHPGSLCFHWDTEKKRMSHVGVYAGNGRVIEAKGTKYGVVESTMPGSWTHFGNLKELNYPSTLLPSPRHTLLYKGSRGAEVKELQTLLNQKLAGIKGFVPLAVDGSFGRKTDAAVRLYQKLHGLTVDGEVGTQTWGSLLS